MDRTHSAALFERACGSLPGGVNSPVRAFGGVGGSPLFIAEAKGPYVTDADGKRYLDYVGSWGPMILGHAPDEVIAAVNKAAKKGTSFGAPTELEVQLAELVCELVPSVEMVRFTSSGTEAVMSAVRLARAFTKRDQIIKFNGCYHGHSDSMLVAAGSGVATLGIPGSPGIPAAIAALTASIEFNDLEQCEDLVKKIGGEKIAAIIVEPIAANIGLILPKPGFLEGLRQLCDRHGMLLIFDEVITGFRVAIGGAQEHYAVRPDLTTLGKILGGGLPAAAFGGRKEIMKNVAPLGPVYQAGTLSGNPLAMAAGLATLKILRETSPYPALEEKAQTLVAGLKQTAKESQIDVEANYIGSIIGLFFTNREVVNYSDVKRTDNERFKRYFHLMLAKGIYLAPSAFEVGFISTTHTIEHIRETLSAAKDVFARL